VKEVTDRGRTEAVRFSDPGGNTGNSHGDDVIAMLTQQEVIHPKIGMFWC